MRAIDARTSAARTLSFGYGIDRSGAKNTGDRLARRHHRIIGQRHTRSPLRQQREDLLLLADVPVAIAGAERQTQRLGRRQAFRNVLLHPVHQRLCRHGCCRIHDNTEVRPGFHRLANEHIHTRAERDQVRVQPRAWTKRLRKPRATKRRAPGDANAAGFGLHCIAAVQQAAIGVLPHFSNCTFDLTLQPTTWRSTTGTSQDGHQSLGRHFDIVINDSVYLHLLILSIVALLGRHSAAATAWHVP